MTFKTYAILHTNIWIDAFVDMYCGSDFVATSRLLNQFHQCGDLKMLFKHTCFKANISSALNLGYKYRMNNLYVYKLYFYILVN